MKTTDSDDDSLDSDIMILKKMEKHNKRLVECKVSYKKGQDWEETTCLLDIGADDCLISRKDVEKMLGEEYVKEKIRPSESFYSVSVDITL